MSFAWHYFRLAADGYLTLDTVNGSDPFRRCFASDGSGIGGHIQPHPFANEAEAEEWLKDADIRGSVVSVGS
jgi:hypothetical protein